MSVMDVDVSRFVLCVAARDTVNAVLDSGDRERGERLDDALQAACGDDAAFVVHPFIHVENADFPPGPSTDDDWPEVNDRWEAGALRKLEKSGFVESWDVFSETTGTSYLDEGRVLTAVRVLRPFTIVTVCYSWSGRLEGYADRWTITNQTSAVNPGTYLVGYVGDFALSQVGATGIDTAGENEAGISDETLFYWMVEHEGFLASLCLAECDTCDGRWQAESGSWHFQPEYETDVSGFYFDDVEDPDGATIECQNCALGRIGFLII